VAGTVAKRVLQLIFVLWAVSTLVFLLTRISGNPASVVAGPNATHAQLEQVEKTFGLTDSILVQYVKFLGGAVHLDFGLSFTTKTSAMARVTDRIGDSAILAASAALLSLLISVPLGVIAGVSKSRFARLTIQGGTLIGQSVPSFVLGVVLVLFFAVDLKWLPSIGFSSAESLILPAITLSAFLTARQTRLIATYMGEEMDKPYVRTARVCGFSERRIRYLHVLPNALIPIISLFGLDVAEFFAGAIITETVFAWPGVGRLVVESVLSRDYPVIQAAVFVIAIAVVLVNLLADITYRSIDPRLRA
jgi:peptide/nickel transport system permease protein